MELLAFILMSQPRSYSTYIFVDLHGVPDEMRVSCCSSGVDFGMLGVEFPKRTQVVSCVGAVLMYMKITNEHHGMVLLSSEANYSIYGICSILY